MSNPSPSQLLALRLASVEPLRYYRGGWVSTPTAAGALRDQRTTSGAFVSTHNGFTGEYVTAVTVEACVIRGWLTNSKGKDIYARRWTLTDAGRAVLEEAEKGQP